MSSTFFLIETKQLINLADLTISAYTMKFITDDLWDAVIEKLTRNSNVYQPTVLRIKFLAFLSVWYIGDDHS